MEQYVLPPRDGRVTRFQVMPPELAAQMAEVAAESIQNGITVSRGIAYTHRLTVRRMRELMNSQGINLKGIRKRTPFNPAFLHPDDFGPLGIRPGQRVEIVSGHGRIPAVAKADDSMLPGVVSMTHAWGGLPDEPGGYEAHGASTNLLISNEQDFEFENAMVRMTAIPVNIVPASSPTL